MKAVEALLPLAFAGFQKGMLSFSKAPITMEVTDTRVRFSAPESSVDMEVMKRLQRPGRQGHEPACRGVAELHPVQRVSHPHTSATHNWKHSGTNGFTSKWDVGSK